MGDIQRIRELNNILNQCRDAYYNEAKALISDEEYDRMFDELEQLEMRTGCIYTNSPTQTVGYEVKSKLEKTIHSHPMLSLGKTKSVTKLKEFAGDQECILSAKMDGLTILLTYEDGKLVKAETRGNGTEGELVTHTAKVFDNIPLTIMAKTHFEIEGEAIITYDDFEKINAKLPEDKKYKNPRNLAAGSVRQLDSKTAKQRHIKFIAWKLPSGFSTYESGFKCAQAMGFEIVPYITCKKPTKESLERLIEEVKQFACEKSYPIDGLVMSYNDVKYGQSLGMTSHEPRHSIAYKFFEDEEVTTIRDIEWGMGKTGVLTPVAIFDDVELYNTTVNRATLHNVSIMKDLQIGIGDEVTIYKANEIIPAVRDNLTRSGTAKIPSTCPICGGKTEIVKENESEVLICTNPTCVGKLLGRLSHAVSRNALNIDGLSEATIDKFITLGWLKSIKDIYHLKDYELRMKNLEGFGSKSVTKLLDSIENSRKTTLDRFLYSLSVPLLGKTASKAIAQAEDYNFNSFIQDMIHPGAEFFRHIPGIGDSLINSLNQYFSRDCYEIYSLAEEFEFQKPKPIFKMLGVQKNLTGKTFVITGSLEHFSNREEAKAQIEALGGKVSGSVSAKTSYLVNNDPNSTSSKNVKAKKLSVPIITEQELLSMIS